jgi:glycine/D-amino acid oxidase-like deaminating enzyme
VNVVERALADADLTPLWEPLGPGEQPRPALDGDTEADLVVVGGGLTGLWAAICAKDEDPARDVMLLEGGTVASGASGRNGGFVSDSLTHGLAHGVATWPDEIDALLRLGRENLAETAAFCDREGIDASLRLCGKSVVATRTHQLADLERAHALHLAHGEDTELLDAKQAQADVCSPTYLGALRSRSGGGLLDPAALCRGLVRVAVERGVRLHERTRVTGVRTRGRGVRVSTSSGEVRARQVLLATNAFPPLLRRLRARVIPVHDHVLATEPLSAEQMTSLGWVERQGLTDAGNQFHYYRRTDDDRIVWGGYDAVYYRGARTLPVREQVDRSHRLLAGHFLETFPQLQGVRFTHRWSGVIDTTSRFTPMFGTAMDGRVAYSMGYTGLGVGSSRFGARVALDLLAGRETERTRLRMVRSMPVPFPPEPLRYPVVQLTRAAMARQDERGRRGLLLRTMDRFGVGFDS